MCIYNVTTLCWHFSRAGKDTQVSMTWNSESSHLTTMGSKSERDFTKPLLKVTKKQHLDQLIRAGPTKQHCWHTSLGSKNQYPLSTQSIWTGQQATEEHRNTGGAWIACQEIKPQLLRGKQSQSKANQSSTGLTGFLSIFVFVFQLFFFHFYLRKCF